jgi:hypothetical protein
VFEGTSGDTQAASGVMSFTSTANDTYFFL